ncbi:hypothetical protein PCASD_22857 [Puccinia coronata f. sp. avenae]|uniref:BHLH domain-containing protein n=1 Tax=Puccinia coronata f. sp. avenae TaxID=200324 RepID=A0A2N5S399_9BASI|nr:hypothetical protein PCASD_22857 [Puccinia coronata f. sp. avenae]
MSSHPQSSSPAFHDRDQQQHSIAPKRFNGFFSQSQTPSDPQQPFNNTLLGSQQQPAYHQFTSSFTDDELLESLIHRQSISSPQHHHHQPIPITSTPVAASSDTERRGSFSSSVHMEDYHSLLSPSSSAHPIQFSHSPSRLSQLSAAHHPLRQSRSPQPKPLGNRHMYPFSPPTSITTTLVDEERSPAISTISVTDSITHHSLSSSQPTCSSFYHPMTSPDDSAILRSPIDHVSSNELSLSSSLPTRRTFSPHAIVDQHKLALNEKIRKRRESHNAVERRRRDNINDRITELAGLLPNCLLDPVVTPSESGMMMVVSEEPCQTDDAQTLNYTHNKPNKGFILAKSVDYIKHLKHLLELQSQRNSELEAELSRVRSTESSNNPDQEERSKVPGEDDQNVQRKESSGDSPSDQIHEWIKMHDQQNQQKSKLNEENTFMMTTGALPYRADQESGDRHHPSDSDSASLHPHTFSPSEAFKSNDNSRFQNATDDHFPAHFNHHLSGFESIYHHLQ